MRSRCNNPNNPKFAGWGGRGIKVCTEWDSFAAFQAWALSSGYKESLSIERKNNDAGYSPDNCIWANSITQARNRRIVKTAPDGRSWAEIAEENGIPVAVMNNRISAGGWTPEIAATWPLGMRRAAPLLRDEKGRITPQESAWRRRK